MACPSGPADEEPVLHAADVVLPIAEAPLPDGGVLVAAGHIVAVGPRASLEPRARSVRRWPGVLLPGLVNAHAHLQYTGFADLATSGLPFFPWIRALTARRREYDAAAWLGDARRGMDLAMRSGTTCVADVVSDLGALGAWDASDLTGIAYLEVVGADTTRWTGGGRARLLDALAAAPTGVPVGVSPHALYTLGTAVLTDCVRIAREHGARLHTHLAETAAESEYVLAAGGPFAAANTKLGFAFELLERGGSGRTPTALLDRLGGLGVDCHVAHGVHVDAADRRLLRDRGSVVALCPRSNRILGAGEPPVAAYLREGNPIAVGTDSLASSPSLDLLEDVAAVAELARAQGYTEDDLARRVVEAATQGGARALGRRDIGSLVPGARADLAVFDVGPHPQGADPYAAVARAAGRCVGVVLSGRVVHERLSG